MKDIDLDYLEKVKLSYIHNGFTCGFLLGLGIGLALLGVATGIALAAAAYL